ncbi:hypothetical protein [Phenylobacterium sp.]|uniref:hypothetical protein n=1 Tax=Phenylobacterium sp. TaxID=1871053 RepID=UPI0025F7C864|nr:hypothetical protein [Phenylobacterium sp.]
MKDRMLVAYEEGGRNKLDSVRPRFDLTTAALCASDYPATSAQAKRLGSETGKLMAVVPLERASAAVLAERGFGGAELDRAWEALGPKRRSYLRTVADAIDGKAEIDPAAYAEVVVDFAELAGWAPREGDASPMEPIADYIMARAAREGLEAR